MASVLAVLLGAVAPTYFFLRLLLHLTQDAKEPTAIKTSVPFIGPILSMIANKTHFHTYLRDKYNLPIYTLRLPGSRIYVVNSTALITAVQRQPAILAFPPIEVRAVVNAMGASKTAEAILNKDLDPKDGNWGNAFAVTFSKAIHPALSPGANLDAMNRAAIQNVAEIVERLASRPTKHVKLFEWAVHELSIATTDAVYGPMNPFKDPAVEAAFWRFGPGIVILLINLLPSILARKSVQARELIAVAMKRYFNDKGYEQGSALVKARVDHSLEYNVTMADIARFEIGGALAVIANTGPAGFWLIYHVFSDPIVLEEVRDELSKIVVEEPGGHKIDLSDIKTSCPILLSTLQEVLRFHSIGTSVRVVMEDHILDGKYLLKKGGTVMIPGAVQHSYPSIWGENVAEFNHRRFVRSTNNKRPNPIAFRSFGGGTTLCPGRHFASTEIISFAALMALRFDITPINGKWVRPTTENAEMWTTIPQPDHDIPVEIALRKGGNAEGKWNVMFSGSDKVMELSAEDVKGK
ncbi:cytochrome P450 [Bisporella sp. PMI_857]|nr:cytochrome P450 [Bisporella sp. PMI_857]